MKFSKFFEAVPKLKKPLVPPPLPEDSDVEDIAPVSPSTGEKPSLYDRRIMPPERKKSLSDIYADIQAPDEPSTGMPTPPKKKVSRRGDPSILQKAKLYKDIGLTSKPKAITPVKEPTVKEPEKIEPEVTEPVSSEPEITPEITPETPSATLPTEPSATEPTPETEPDVVDKLDQEISATETPEPTQVEPPKEKPPLKSKTPISEEEKSRAIEDLKNTPLYRGTKTPGAKVPSPLSKEFSIELIQLYDPDLYVSLITPKTFEKPGMRKAYYKDLSESDTNKKYGLRFDKYFVPFNPADIGGKTAIEACIGYESTYGGDESVDSIKQFFDYSQFSKEGEDVKSGLVRMKDSLKNIYNPDYDYSDTLRKNVTDYINQNKNLAWDSDNVDVIKRKTVEALSKSVPSVEKTEIARLWDAFGDQYGANNYPDIVVSLKHFYNIKKIQFETENGTHSLVDNSLKDIPGAAQQFKKKTEQDSNLFYNSYEAGLSFYDPDYSRRNLSFMFTPDYNFDEADQGELKKLKIESTTTKTPSKDVPLGAEDETLETKLFGPLHMEFGDDSETLNSILGMMKNLDHRNVIWGSLEDYNNNPDEYKKNMLSMTMISLQNTIKVYTTEKYQFFDPSNMQNAKNIANSFREQLIPRINDLKMKIDGSSITEQELGKAYADMSKLISDEKMKKSFDTQVGKIFAIQSEILTDKYVVIPTDKKNRLSCKYQILSRDEEELKPVSVPVVMMKNIKDDSARMTDNSAIGFVSTCEYNTKVPNSGAHIPSSMLIAKNVSNLKPDNVNKREYIHKILRSGMSDKMYDLLLAGEGGVADVELPSKDEVREKILSDKWEELKGVEDRIINNLNNKETKPLIIRQVMRDAGVNTIAFHNTMREIASILKSEGSDPKNPTIDENKLDRFCSLMVSTYESGKKEGMKKSFKNVFRAIGKKVVSEKEGQDSTVTFDKMVDLSKLDPNELQILCLLGAIVNKVKENFSFHAVIPDENGWINKENYGVKSAGEKNMSTKVIGFLSEYAINPIPDEATRSIQIGKRPPSVATALRRQLSDLANEMKGTK